MNRKPIVVSRNINAPIQKIWDAITLPSEMKQWYFTDIPDFQAKIGFSTSFIIRNEGKTFTHQWEVTEITDKKSITYSWQYAEYAGLSYSQFTIEGNEQGSDLSVICTGLESFPSDIPEFERESCEGGWNYFLNRLKEYCEK